MNSILLRSVRTSQCYRQPLFVLNRRSLCSSSSDDEKLKKPAKKTTVKSKNDNESINKLNELLKQITQVANEPSKQKLNLAKPRGRNAKTEPGLKSAKVESVEEKLVTAVKDVASSLGGNTTQTETELLSKALNGQNQVPISNLSDIVKGMKIDRDSKPEQSVSRAQQVKKLMETKKQQMQPGDNLQRFQRRQPRQRHDVVPSEPIDIFGAEPLGIFTNQDSKQLEEPMNPTWDKLYARELKLAVTHPPANYFQEQILWTEQGKIWKFPIDNEQGMEEEQNVYFADHVFLEEYLEPWCPAKGPLRHFMELVCVGMSKNPYMSVQDKRDHIKWYENYFENKKKLLKEVGALPAQDKVPKQVEAE